MNEVHIRGQIKTQPWSYDGNLYVRISVQSDKQRPARSAQDGGSYDYVTVMFPGGVQQGLEMHKHQFIAVHGWLQSRDVHESLTDILTRANNKGSKDLSELPAALLQIDVHRSIVEVIADRWSVEGGKDRHLP